MSNIIDMISVIIIVLGSFSFAKIIEVGYYRMFENIESQEKCDNV